jgi:alkylation response protein AidB-like acyl-CoA dehydrogenase
VDFALGETKQAVALAAAHVLDRSQPPPAPPAPATGDPADRAAWDEALWKELGQVGLLGLALPAWLGGDGLGVMDTAEQLQQLGQLLEEIVGRHGDPADEETAGLSRWLDIQAKRNTVLTFGGGANEIQRELIATAGLGLPRVPR